MPFYEPLGSGDFASTPSTAGPWESGLQHGGPPSALLTRALERESPRADMRLARVTVEILGPIPVAPLTVVAEVVRPGRRVELVEASARVDGRPVARATGWRIAVGDGQAVDVIEDEPVLPLPDSATPPSFTADGATFGYGDAGEWRFASGSFRDPGPAVVWHRLRTEVVAGEEPSGWQRVMAVADSGNGISAVLPLAEWYFINPDLTVYLRREPVGEWICLDARTQIAADGIGLATSILADRDGRIGRGNQSLLVTRR